MNFLKMKTQRFVFAISILLFIVAGTGCDKKNDSELQIQNGLVLNYGEPALDGCGWVIQLNKVDYSPVNLDAKFQKDSLKVAVEYQILKSTFNCGWGGHGYQQIKITSIK